MALDWDRHRERMQTLARKTASNQELLLFGDSTDHCTDHCIIIYEGVYVHRIFTLTIFRTLISWPSSQPTDEKLQYCKSARSVIYKICSIFSQTIKLYTVWKRTGNACKIQQCQVSMKQSFDPCRYIRTATCVWGKLCSIPVILVHRQ